MQTATFIKSIKWLYALEIDESLDYFRTGFSHYLDAGRAGIQSGIEETYTRGIHLNSRVRQIEDHATAPMVLDAFGLSTVYDGDWWQTVVAAFLKLLASSEETESASDTVKEMLGTLGDLSERMRILLSCVGPLQQLVVPSAVLRQSDFDETLTLEVHPTTGPVSPTINRMEAVLTATSELYVTMCRIHGIEEPQPLRVLHMSSEDGFKFDFSGDGTIIVDVKKLLADVWLRIRNQDAPHIKDLNRAIVGNLAPCQKIEERLASGDLTQETAGQLRHQLSALAMKMFDHGVQIREIPDTDTVDNRLLMEQISQRRLPSPEVQTEPEPAATVRPAAGPKKRTASPRKKSESSRKSATATAKESKAKTSRSATTARSTKPSAAKPKSRRKAA